jgi:hypothetical protein
MPDQDGMVKTLCCLCKFSAAQAPSGTGLLRNEPNL